MSTPDDLWLLLSCSGLCEASDRAYVIRLRAASSFDALLSLSGQACAIKASRVSSTAGASSSTSCKLATLPSVVAYSSQLAIGASYIVWITLILTMTPAQCTSDIERKLPDKN